MIEVSEKVFEKVFLVFLKLDIFNKPKSLVPTNLGKKSKVRQIHESVLRYMVFRKSFVTELVLITKNDLKFLVFF